MPCLRIVLIATMILSGCNRTAPQPKSNIRQCTPYLTPAWGAISVEGRFEFPSSLAVILLNDDPEDQRYLLKSLTYTEELEYRYSGSVPRSQGSDAPAVYEFNARARTIRITEGEVWDKAIASGYPVTGRYPRVIQSKQASTPLVEVPIQVSAGGFPVPPRKALAKVPATKSDILAELSANGERQMNLIPFLGGDNYSGQRFHQFFRISAVQPLSFPILIPFGEHKGVKEPVWSPDDRFVFYCAEDFSELCVIPVTERSPPASNNNTE